MKGECLALHEHRVVTYQESCPVLPVSLWGNPSRVANQSDLSIIDREVHSLRVTVVIFHSWIPSSLKTGLVVAVMS
jgi:hypothetical protein